MSSADGGSSYRKSESTGSAATDSSLDVAWQHVLDGFEDDRRHDAFISFAREHGGLHVAARNYRDLRDDPVRGPKAVAKLKAVSFLATHELLSSRTAPPNPWRRWLWLVGAAGLVSIFTLLVAFCASR